jgi:pyrroline-5-carboxylate reductase
LRETPTRRAGSAPNFQRFDYQFVPPDAAAGTLIATFENILGKGTAVLRCMPNTPAAIGKGVLVCCANENVGSVARAFCEKLLSSSGRFAFVDDENLMGAVTGVSGQGDESQRDHGRCLRSVDGRRPPEVAGDGYRACCYCAFARLMR